MWSLIKSIRLIFLFILFLYSLLALANRHLPLSQLQLPSSFNISIYADNVPSARQVAIADNGVVFIGTRDEGKVYVLLPDKNGHHSKRVITLLKNLNRPNGVAFRNGSLYVAEIQRITRYDDILNHLDHPPKPKLVSDGFPDKKWHGYKYLKFGPDGWLYTAVGMPCNTCNYRGKDDRFGTIMRLRENGKDLEVYEKGIRNTVGFDWNPTNKQLWFTDNGQDWMGDNLPPDEINHAVRSGQDFGFPFFYGDNIPAPDYKNKNILSKGMTPPVFELPAHVAPLGMTFYTGKQFPKKYRGMIVFVEHGSWNRSRKVGYKVMVAFVKNNKIERVEPLVKGWLQGQKEWGRPVDVVQMKDGSLLISDDLAGVVYRLSFNQ